MPGKKPSDASWRWASPMRALRQVTGVDANVDAVNEIIDMSKPEDADVKDLQQAYDNVLYLGILPVAGITAVTVRIFVEATPINNADNDVTGWTPLTGDQYAKIHEQGVTGPVIIAVRDIYASKVKVVISSFTGAGTLSVVYSRSE